MLVLMFCRKFKNNFLKKMKNFLRGVGILEQIYIQDACTCWNGVYFLLVGHFFFRGKYGQLTVLVST